MDYDKISARLILASILIFLIPFTGKCQNSITGEIIVSGLYDMQDDSLKSYLKGDAIFILITNKNCIKCFNEACEYISKKYSVDQKVYGIMLMPKNYLALTSVTQKSKDEIPCAENIYFYFTNDKQPDEIKKITDSPSPQFVIKTGNNYTYIPYADVLKLIE